MRISRSMLALCTSVAALLAGCSTSTTAPSATVPGTYVATVPGAGSTAAAGSLVVTSTQNGAATALDVRGADIRVVLAADGSTTGRLYIPTTAQGAGADADLAGTWQRTNDVLTLRHSADTFLRDMPLTVRGGEPLELVGDATFGATRVQLTLVRR